MSPARTWPVPSGSAGRRLDEVVAELAGVSRAAAARWAADGRVLVDGRPRPKSHRLHGGEVLAWDPPPEPEAGPPAGEAVPLAVRWEDDHLLVVAKPAGLVVHPAPGHPAGTLVNALLGRAAPASGEAAPLASGEVAPPAAGEVASRASGDSASRASGEVAGTGLSAAGGSDRPGIVHRLDKDTSGLLVVAKDDATHLALARELAAHRVERGYLALVQGHLAAGSGTVDAPVGRHPRDRKRMAVVASGRRAVTHWQVEERLRAADLIEARLETGRTHQIRVHLAHLRHPVAGDRTYGADPALAARLGLGRPFLHAWRLAFRHPATGQEVTVTDPLPAELGAVLDRLRQEG